MGVLGVLLVPGSYAVAPNHRDYQQQRDQPCRYRKDTETAKPGEPSLWSALASEARQQRGHAEWRLPRVCRL